MTNEEKQRVEKVLYRFNLLKQVISDARDNQEEGTPYSQDVRFIISIEMMETIEEALTKLCRVTENTPK